MAETVYLVAINPARIQPIECISPGMDGLPVYTRVRDAVPLIELGQRCRLHTTYDGVERAARVVAELMP